MNKLDLSLALDPNIALFTAGTIDFLQAAYQQGFSATIQTLIGADYDATKVYILYGCEYTISGTGHMTSGVIFFNGEFYLSPTQIVLLTTGVLRCNLTVTPYSTSLGGDPMEFDNAGTITTSNVHNQRIITYSYGTSGTGTLTGTTNGDYDNAIRLDTGFISTGISFTATLQNLWGNDLTTNYYNVGYLKKGNLVNLCGLAVNTSVTGGSDTIDIMILPHIIRPSKIVNLVVITDTGVAIKLTISTTGAVTSTHAVLGITSISLDGLSYRLN